MNIKYFLIIVFLVRINVDLTAQSLNRMESLRMINEGDISLRYGNLEQAIFQYGNAIAADPNFARNR
jgi:hypothetical protein